MAKQTVRRDFTLWAVVLTLVGLGALVLAYVSCQQANAEAGERALWAILVAIVAEVAGVVLSNRELRKPGRRGLVAGGLDAVRFVGLLALLASLFLGFVGMFGVCSGNPL